MRDSHDMLKRAYRPGGTRIFNERKENTMQTKNQILESSKDCKLPYVINQIVSDSSEDSFAEALNAAPKNTVSYEVVFKDGEKVVELSIGLNPMRALYETAEHAIDTYFAS